MSIKSMFKILLVALVCTAYAPKAYSMDEVRLSTEEIVDLAFRNCPELLEYLGTDRIQSSQYEKFQIGEAITRILTLETPNIPSGTQTSSMVYDTYFPSDISRVLDPGREEEAKLCAIQALLLISPQAIAFVPTLHKLAIQKTLSSNIRLEALDASHAILSGIHAPLDEETRQMLLRQTEKHMHVISDPVSISLLAHLARFHMETLIDIMSKDNRTIPVGMMAIAGTDPDGIKSISLLGKRLGSWDQNATAMILKHLTLFSSQAAPYIIELAGELLPTLSENIHPHLFDLLSRITETPASYDIHFTNSAFPEEILDNYLSFLESAKPKYRHIIFRLLSSIKVAESCQACTFNDTDLPSPLLKSEPSAEYISSILLHLICPLKDRKKLIFWLEGDNYARKIIAIASLGHHSAFDEASTIAVHKLLSRTARDKKNKELEQLGSLALSYLTQASYNRQIHRLTDSAIENLQTSGELPPVFNELLSHDRHPAISFLLTHGRKSLPKVKGLLEHKSSLVRLRALGIFSSPEIPYVPSHTPLLIKLLDDPEPELRILSYETLKKHTRESDFKLFAQNLKNENMLKRFYTSTIIFDKFMSSIQNKQGVNAKNSDAVSGLFDAYTSTLPSVPCSERVNFIPQGLIDTFQEQSRVIKSDIARHYIECLVTSQENFNGVSGFLGNIKQITPSVANLLLTQLSKRKNISFTARTFTQLISLFSHKQLKAKTPEFIENFLTFSKDEESIYLYQWLSDHPEFTWTHPEALEIILKNSYQNRMTNELNKLFLKMIRRELSAETWYTELNKIKLEPDSLRILISLLPRSELYAILNFLRKKERFDSSFVHFKTQACSIAPFEDVCKMLFTEIKPAVLDHPTMLFSALLFQIDRYTDYENCDSSDDLNLVSCEDRKIAVLHEAVSLLEKMLLSGSWLQVHHPAKSAREVIDAIDQVIYSRAPHHIDALLHLFRRKLIGESAAVL